MDIGRLALLALLPLLMVCPTVAGADDWVVGSFSDNARARAEAARLRDALGMEVRISASHPHRLLVDARAIDPDLAPAAFRAAGVEGAWRLRRAESGASVPVSDESVSDSTWLLLGDFEDVQASIDVEIRLSRTFRGVVSESVIDDGRLRHRVMLGPVRAGDLAEFRRRLAALGVEAPTLIDAPAGTYTTFASVKPAGPERQVRPATDEITPPSRPSDGFNFATLRQRQDTTASPR